MNKIGSRTPQNSSVMSKFEKKLRPYQRRVPYNYKTNTESQEQNSNKCWKEIENFAACERKIPLHKVAEFLSNNEVKTKRSITVLLKSEFGTDKRMNYKDFRKICSGGAIMNILNDLYNNPNRKKLGEIMYISSYK